MKPTPISVTQAARNFADCVNRVHYQNMTFILLKNGTPFARLTPEDHRECTGRHLASVLDGARLTSSEARAWRGEIKSARKSLKAQADKWQ
jgi:antitoxin (DNA-binding transcriptional repressor) of toxin-antitoxin stability system